VRKYALFSVLLLLVSTTLLAQDRDRDRDDSWRRRPAYSNTLNPDAFELTPFVGYRWGGTVFADNTLFFSEDLQVEASPSFGAEIGIPLGGTGLKVTLIANHQASQLETDGGLFEPEDDIADFDVTYFHGGLQIPFARSSNVIPYAIVSAGLTRLDPQLSGVSDETRFSASGGVGVKLPMSRNFALRLEGRGFYTALEDNQECGFCDYFVDQNFYQGEVNVGFTFSF